MHNLTSLRIFKHFQIDGRTAPATCAVLVVIGSLLLSDFHKIVTEEQGFLHKLKAKFQLFYQFLPKPELI